MFGVICHLLKSSHSVPKYSSCELASLNNYQYNFTKKNV